MGSGFNAASQLISLPKGRGAVEGIAAIKMRRKLFAIGNFSVQIALPPGPSGFKPQLNLVCTTGNGKSPFGFGWVLGVPGASRRTPKGVPRYGDLTDSFPLSGSEHLVPVTTPVADIIQYRPRTEGLFAKIFHHNAPPDNYCEVKTKDGLTSLHLQSTFSVQEEAMRAHGREGNWTLRSPNTAATASVFQHGQIQETLFVIIYNCSTPAWPS
jgi:hypothetical protein